jgi:hypothetical protein
MNPFGRPLLCFPFPHQQHIWWPQGSLSPATCLLLVCIAKTSNAPNWCPAVKEGHARCSAYSALWMSSICMMPGWLTIPTKRPVSADNTVRAVNEDTFTSLLKAVHENQRHSQHQQCSCTKKIPLCCTRHVQERPWSRQGLQHGHGHAWLGCMARCDI